MDNYRAGSARLEVNPDFSRFRERANAEIRGIVLNPIDVLVRADTSRLRRQIQNDTRTMGGTIDLDVTLDLTRARAQMSAFRSSIRDIEIEVDLDTTNARNGLFALRQAANSLRDVLNDIDLSGGGGGRGGGFLGAGAGAASSGISSIGSAARFAMPALVALGALTLIPLIGSIREAVGVIALLPAAAATAAAAIGTLVIGFQGIGDAITAGKEATANASAEAASAAASVAAANRGIADAIDGVTTAEKAQRRAVESAEDAQKDLTRARKQATEQIEDMNLALRGSALDEEDAILSVERAAERLRNLGQDGPVSALDRREADLAYRQSLLRLEQVRESNADQREEAAQMQKDGIEGSDLVVQAKRRIVDADEAVIDSNKAVAKALEAVTDAQAAAAAAAAAGSPSLDAYNKALENLSPNARDLVIQLRDLGGAWKDLRLAVQDNLLEGMGTDITELADAQLPRLQVGLEGIADVMNENFRGALDFLSTEEFGLDLTRILENSRIAIDNLLGAFGALGEALIDIAAVGSDFFPGLTGEDGFLGWSTNFADRMKEMSEDGSLAVWLQGAIDKFGEVWTIMGSVFELFRNILDGSEETGDSMLVSIQKTLDKWNEFLGSEEGQESLKAFFEDIRTTCQAIADIISGAAAIVGYFTPDAPVPAKGTPGVPGLGGGGGSFDGSIDAGGPSVGDRINKYLGLGMGRTMPEGAGSPLLGGVNDEGVYQRDIIGKAWDKVGSIGDWFGGGVFDGLGAEEGQSPASALWDRMFGGDDEKPKVGSGQGPRGARDYDALAEQLEGAPGNEDQGVFGGLWDSTTGAVSTGWDATISKAGELGSAISDLGSRFGESISGTASSAWNGLSDSVSDKWENVISPALNAFRENGLTGLADHFTSTITGGAIPTFGELPTAIGDGISKMVGEHFPGLKTGLQSVRDFFGEVVEGIRSVWSQLGGYLAEPINWVISNVINGGIGRAWGAVDGFLGGKLPDWTDVGLIGMESGGFVPREPGTQWGKDGVLRILAPGEVVMSKPAVDRAGVDNLLAFNSAALGGKAPTSEGLFQLGMETGGRVSRSDPAWDALKRGHDFAASQDGKPYQWAGPRFVDDSFDCTGFMSSIASAILEQNVWTRKFFTGSFTGGEPAPMGFKKGLGAGFSIGIHDDPGGAGGGHAAGTLSGVEGLPDINVEAGGRGGDVQYGRGAAGASNSQFPWKYHLPIVDGTFVDPGPGGGGSGPTASDQSSIVGRFFDKIMDPIKTRIDEAFGEPPPQSNEIPGAMFDSLRGVVKDAISDATRTIDVVADGIRKLTEIVTNPVTSIGDFIFDRDTGGNLPPGLSLVNNRTKEDEYVLEPEGFAAIRDLIGVLGGGISGNGQQRQQEANPNGGGGAAVGAGGGYDYAGRLGQYGQEMTGIASDSVLEYVGLEGTLVDPSNLYISSLLEAMKATGPMSGGAMVPVDPYAGQGLAKGEQITNGAVGATGDVDNSTTYNITVADLEEAMRNIRAGEAQKALQFAGRWS